MLVPHCQKGENQLVAAVLSSLLTSLSGQYYKKVNTLPPSNSSPQKLSQRTEAHMQDIHSILCVSAKSWKKIQVSTRCSQKWNKATVGTDVAQMGRLVNNESKCIPSLLVCYQKGHLCVCLDRSGGFWEHTLAI